MTATELKKRAIALAEKTKIDSVTPEEVGQLSNDIVEYIENVEINGSSLGIRKTYTSVSAMESDSTAPKDDKGVLLRRGMLVNIYNQEDPESADNGKVFSFQNPGWAFRGTIDAGYATRDELTELVEESSTYSYKDYNLNIGTTEQDKSAFIIPKSRSIILLFTCDTGLYVNDEIGVITDNTTDFVHLVKINTPTIFTFEDDSAKTFGINIQSSSVIQNGKIRMSVYTGSYVDTLESINRLNSKILLSLDGIFSFNNLQVNSESISFENFSFLYIKSESEKKYKRCIIKSGSYDLPEGINKAIAVSIDKYDDSGYLIPFSTDVEVQEVKDNLYIIGYNNSVGEFLLNDSSTVYNVLNKKINTAQQTANTAQQTANTAQQTANTAQQTANTAKKDVDKLYSQFSNDYILIPDYTLKANIKSRLGKDGRIITKEEFGEYSVVSDFIPLLGTIEQIIAAFNTLDESGNTAALAFYSSESEDSFISSVYEMTDNIEGAWYTYKGVPEQPESAKYIRIAGHTLLNSESPSIKMYTTSVKNNYSNSPSTGYEFFNYDVDTSKEDVEDNDKKTNIIYPSEISKDNGFIRLPESYTRTGEPTRLVIINHGAGGQVTDSISENGNSSFALLLQKKGYAILCVNGVPEKMRNTKYMNAEQNGAATHMGGWVYMRSALAAYKYVVEKYNIARDGCFVIGRSMGGITSLNLAMSGVIPVKALALDAPVIDSFHDAYFSGNWSGGTLEGSTPAIFAWIYQWDFCNFEDDTYTIPKGQYDIYGQSYNVQTEEKKSLSTLKDNQQDMSILWHLNENKMCGYNAYKTNDFLYKNLDEEHIYDLTTDNDDKYFGKKLPCPCKIWFGSGDTVNQIDIARRFVKKARNGGSIVMLRTCPTNRHTIWEEMETIPDGTNISVVEDGIKCSPYAVELWNWIKRWDS